MTTYKSKIGLELLVPIIIIVGAVGIIALVSKAWIELCIILLVIGFITHLFLATYYQVIGNELKVKSGFVFNKTIKIDTITQIKETNNPISAPAISLDRIVISYNKYDSIIISPKDKKAFISHLTQINSNIRVVLKNKMKPGIVER